MLLADNFRGLLLHRCTIRRCTGYDESGERVFGNADVLNVPCLITGTRVRSVAVRGKTHMVQYEAQFDERTSLKVEDMILNAVTQYGHSILPSCTIVSVEELIDPYEGKVGVVVSLTSDQ